MTINYCGLSGGKGSTRSTAKALWFIHRLTLVSLLGVVSVPSYAWTYKCVCCCYQGTRCTQGKFCKYGIPPGMEITCPNKKTMLTGGIPPRNPCKPGSLYFDNKNAILYTCVDPKKVWIKWQPTKKVGDARENPAVSIQSAELNSAVTGESASVNHTP